MRKLALFLVMILLCSPAAAAETEAPKYLALTFDDGPSGMYTRRLLEGLADRDARATFFLCGYRIAQYPELAERICREGHEIGIHGYSHKDMRPMSRREIGKEISDTKALLSERCTVRLLRPPGGCCSDGVDQVAGALGLAVIGWSLDPEDWANHDRGDLVRTVTGQARDGDIILMHDLSGSSVEAALEIVEILRDKGFTFVTVSELARLRDVRLIPGAHYKKFSPDG